MSHGDGNLESQDHTEAGTESLWPELSSAHARHAPPHAPAPFIPHGWAPASPAPTGAPGWGCPHGAASQLSSLLPAHRPLMYPRLFSSSSACLRQEEITLLEKNLIPVLPQNQWIIHIHNELRETWSLDTWDFVNNNSTPLNSKQFSKFLLKVRFTLFDN